ncbi:MAG: hypothetical protein WCB98_03875 [Candidatus Aquirickettsiella gammari]
MSYLKSVIEKLGFESEQKISAFKELFKLTGLNEIEDDEKGFKSKSAALTHLVELTQGTEDKPAWLRWAGQERWDHNDNKSMQINKKEFNSLFNQLALPKEKKPSQRDYAVVLLFGAKQSCVEGRLNYLQSLLDNNELKIEQLVLLGGKRQLMEDEIIDLSGEKERTELEMMKALVDARVKNKQLDKNIEIMPIDTPMKPDGTRPNTADTIEKWLEIRKKSFKISVLAISNQPHICYQDAVLKGVLDKNNLLDSIKVETIGGAMSENEKIVTVLDALARCIHSSRDRLEKLFAPQAQASDKTEAKSSPTYSQTAFTP